MTSSERNARQRALYRERALRGEEPPERRRSRERARRLAAERHGKCDDPQCTCNLPEE